MGSFGMMTDGSERKKIIFFPCQLLEKSSDGSGVICFIVTAKNSGFCAVDMVNLTLRKVIFSLIQ